MFSSLKQNKALTGCAQAVIQQEAISSQKAGLHRDVQPGSRENVLHIPPPQKTDPPPAPQKNPLTEITWK